MSKHDRTDTLENLSSKTPVALTAWAHQHAPHLTVVSNSNPNTKLGTHNLVAVTSDLDTARTLALDFERAAGNDADTTMLVLGHAVDRAKNPSADPEGIMVHAARKALLGGIPGAAICALAFAVAAWFVTNSAAATFASGVGGALFGFFVAAVWGFVIGTGQSEPYQQSFIDPNAADVIIVAVTVEDRALVTQARNTISAPAKVRLFELDKRGRPSS